MAASLGLQTVGGIIGQVMAAKARKKEDALIQDRKSEVKADYAQEISKNPLESAESQSVITKALAQQDDIIEGMQSNAVSGGATQEAQIAAKGELNENFSGLLSGLSVEGSRRKDALKREYRGAKGALFGLELNQAKEKTESAANFASNTANIGAAGLAFGSMSSPGGASPRFHGTTQNAIQREFKYEPQTF